MGHIYALRKFIPPKKEKKINKRKNNAKFFLEKKI